MAINKIGNSPNGIQNSRFRISHNHNIISIMTCALLMTAPLVTYGSAWEALSPTQVCTFPLGKEGYWTSAENFFQDVQCQIDTNPPPQLPACRELSPHAAPTTANGIRTSQYHTNPSSSTSCQKETVLSEHRCVDPKENLEFSGPPDPYTLTCVANQCSATQVWDEKTQACVTPRLPVDPLKNMCSTGLCGTGNPINQATGNKYQIETDYVGAGPYPLRFLRYYNSIESITSTRIGEHWRHYYDRFLIEVDTTTVDVYRHDGKVLTFTESGGTWSPDADVVLTLVEEPSGWTLTTEDDSVETYDVDGKLTAITNRAGFSHTLDYDITSANGGDDDDDTPDKITGHFGRTLLLGYDTSGRIDTLTDPAGEDYTYTYDLVDRLLEVSYPDDDTNPGNNPTRTYHYESTYHARALTGITDEKGNRFATWEYDDDTGFAISSEHAGGAERFDLVYNTDGTTTITDAAGNVQTHHFDTTHGTAQSSQIDGDQCNTCGSQSANTTYDANGFVASRTDFNGNLSKFENNSRGLQTCRIDAFGEIETRMTRTTWDTTYRLPLTIDLYAPPVSNPDLSPVNCAAAESNWVKEKETIFVYDTSGRLTQRTEKDHVSTSDDRVTGNSYYTAADFGGDTTDKRIGLLKQIDGARDNINDVVDTTDFEYDTSGNLIKTTNALGQITEITQYDAHGRPEEIEDPNGVITTLSYDARSRLLTRTAASGTVDAATTSFVYDDVGNIKKTTLPNGSFLLNSYDAAQRLKQIKDNNDNKILFTLDDMGNRTQDRFRDDLNINRFRFEREYNTLNQLIKTIGGEGQVTEFMYDDNGNQTEIKVTLQTTPTLVTQVTTQDYDPLNRLEKSIDPDLNPTLFAYDARDNLIKVTDPIGLETTYDYDGLNNLLEQDSPDTDLTTFTYDDAGNRLTQTDARGIVTTYSYDALNRLTGITYPEVSPGVPNPQNVTFTYDSDSTTCTHGIGRLCEMTDESGTTNYDYDARGNLTQQTITLGSVTRTISYTYNGADQLTQLTYPSGRTVDYTRNGVGQVASVSTAYETPAYTLSENHQYAPFGPLETMDYGNGLAHTRGYDLAYRVDNVTTGTVQDVTYTLDDANNITGITNNLDVTRNQTFDYDLLNRLTDAAGGYGDLDYSYDANGNRLTEDVDSSSLKTYTYNTAHPSTPSHHLLQTVNGGTVTYGYDNNGNTTSNTDYDFIYGDNNRLSEVQVATTTQASYTYNGRGERVKKVGTATTLYYYDQSGQLLAELDGTGESLTEYVYTEGMPLAILRAGTGGAAPAAGEAQVNTYTTNSQGTPAVGALTSGDYVVVWESDGQDGDRNGTYAQRYERGGATVGSEFQVAVATVDNQAKPAVAGLNNGGFVVVWKDGLAFSMEIHARLFDASSQATSNDITISTTADSSARPRVATLNAGRFVVVWYESNEIWATIRDADGSTYKSIYRVNTTTSSAQQDPAVAALTDGGFVVVWHSKDQDGDKKGIFGQRYDATGTTVGSEFQVNTTTAGDQDFPNVTGLSGGGWAVAWRDDNNPKSTYARVYNAAGTAQGNDFQVDSVAGSSQESKRMSIAGTGDGGFMVMWEANGSHLYGRDYDATGTALAVEYQIDESAGMGSGHDVVQLDDGAMAVTWDSGGEVYRKELINAGTAGETTQSGYIHTDHLGTPQIITDQSQIVVWEADYEPFGKATVDEDPDGDGQTVTLNIRFMGQYYDSETGNHYNYYRYYDPKTGRYITSDPIGLGGGNNTYVYVGGNPLSWYDFLGLEPVSSITVSNSKAQVSVTYTSGKTETFPAAVGGPGTTISASGVVVEAKWGAVSNLYTNTQKSWNAKTNPDNPYGAAIILIKGTNGQQIHGTTGPLNDLLDHIGGSKPEDRRFTHGCARLTNKSIVDLMLDVKETLDDPKSKPISVDFIP